MAALTFPDLTTPQGLKHLDRHLSSQTYISGSQASKDDISVYCAIPESPGPELPNASRWYRHITSLIGSRFPGTPVGVKIEKPPSTVLSRELPDEVMIPETPAPATENPAQAEGEDDDLDLFGDETEEEKKAAEEREKSKPASKKKESGKSSVLLEVKPWDDETDLVKLEEAVRSVSMPGLLWGASKLVPVAFNIKKLQIMMTIVDDLVSVDNLIEDYFLQEPRNEYIQSCDIAAFNKI